MNHPISTGESRRSQSSLVTPSSAHPVLDIETQQFLDVVAEAGMHPDDLLLHGQSASGRCAQETTRPDLLPVQTEDLTLPTGPTGSIEIRIVRPLGTRTPLPVVMYFHGGGWSMGDRNTHDRLICRLAAEAGAAVVFVDYTRAPEARYPIQNEEAYAALTYVVEHAHVLGIDGRSIAVAGDGAGGNMAAAMTLLAKSRHGPRIALQVLFYPILSANRTSPSYFRYADGPGLTAHAVESFIHIQFPDECLTETTAMPLNASTVELEGLPPALLITAENDVVRDDGEAYARKLMQAGVEVSATRYLGTIHDFVALEGLADTLPTSTALMQACSAVKAAFLKGGSSRSA